MSIRSIFTAFLLACAFIAATCPRAAAAQFTGVVVDPSGQPIPGAQIAAFTPVGIVTQQITNDQGQFNFYLSPLYDNVQFRVSAPGFLTTTVAMGASHIQLRLAPQSDSVRVIASAIDIPASQQGGSVTTITSADIRGRNEPTASDLLREVPGVIIAQSGPRGSVSSLFVRGGDSKYNLVLLDGIPINSFNGGGLFDFAHIPSDLIEQIDVARGPQSAIYGSYALASVVNFQTRSPENGAAFDLVAEGGTHDENRFALSGSGIIWKNWGLAGSLSSLISNGPVLNSDYRNQDAFLALSHRWRTQSLFAFGDFDSNDVGEPGPFGSDPLHDYTGIDLVSRSRNNTSVYGAHYLNDLLDSLRLDVYAGFNLNNNSYLSPYGYSFNKDIRGHAEARGTWSIFRQWTLAAGYAFDREELRNTFVTNALNQPYLLRRDDGGVYVDNHIIWNKIYIDAGLREEIYQIAGRTDTRLDPRISGAYTLGPSQRLHASYGTGIRPPGGSDLAFTTNPALKPERSQSYDIGVQQQFLKGLVSLDATWFHNRYRDLIVPLGGSLSVLSAFTTANVGDARAEGAEISARFRPSPVLSVLGNYTWLESSILSAQQYVYQGQPLLRRPKHSASAVITYHHGAFDVNLVGYFRNRDLDVEPLNGAAGGLFLSSGYVNAGVNVNYRVHRNMTVYANLHNALDRRYEEIYGFPAPLLNVVAGVKWSLARAR